MKISLIIPAFNEEESIGYVLAAVPTDHISEVIVVDGGSSDNTAIIAQKAGAQVVLEPRRGYGRACATGLKHAHGDIVVFMDADGADDPSQILDLLTPLKNHGAEMVLGSRLSGKIEKGAMPFHQRFGNNLSALLIRLLYGLPITDLSPFRATYREKLLGLNMQEMTYGWPTEMITKAAKRNWKIVEVPVNYSKRVGGKSKISGTFRGTILATYYILTTILRYSLE